MPVGAVSIQVVRTWSGKRVGSVRRAECSNLLAQGESVGPQINHKLLCIKMESKNSTKVSSALIFNASETEITRNDAALFFSPTPIQFRHAVGNSLYSERP